MLDQALFDTMTCIYWKKGWKAGGVMYLFLQRNGYPKPATYEEAYRILVEQGVERVPTEHYWFKNIGVWFMQAYPDFLKAVERSGDASKIVLAWLRFTAPKKTRPPQDHSLKCMQHWNKKYKAALLEDALFKVMHHGDPLRAGRVKCPTGRSKNK